MSNFKLTHVFNEETNEVLGFDVEKQLVFTDPEEGTVPPPPVQYDDKGVAKPQPPAMKYNRIHIKTPDENGNLTRLIIPTDSCFTFGVGEDRSLTDGSLQGWSLPIACWNRDGASDWQLAFSKAIEDISQACVDHLLKQETKEKLKRYDLTAGKLEDVTKKALYWKTDKGVRVPGQGPVFYCKLIVSKKGGLKPMSKFYLDDTVDKDGNPVEVDPTKLVKKYGTVKACVLVSGIFVGSAVTRIQFKLWECDYKPLDSALKRLRPVSKTAVVLDAQDNSVSDLLAGGDEHDEVSTDVVEVKTPVVKSPSGVEKKVEPDKIVVVDGDIHNSDDEHVDTPVEEVPKTKKVVRKVVRKVVKPKE